MHLLTSQMYVARICRFSHCSRVSTVGQPIWNGKTSTFPGKLVLCPFAQLTCEQSQTQTEMIHGEHLSGERVRIM